MTECPKCGVSNPSKFPGTWYCDYCNHAWDRPLKPESGQHE